jgi:hypothetical protein
MPSPLGAVTVWLGWRINARALAADFTSADYPYLRQITECAADWVIDPSLERRFLRR